MSVIIPPRLVEYLRGLGPHFVKVNKEKRAFETGWTKHPYLADDASLQEWLKSGGNYGVIGGKGLIIVEIDNQELRNLAESGLPKTFTVLSPGHKGLHFYFICNLEKSKPLRNPYDADDNWGHLTADGRMVLGPGSIHPNGQKYEIYSDLPLAQITSEVMREFFNPYLNISKKDENRIKKSQNESKINIPIDKVINLSIPPFEESGEHLVGPHPFHPSTTKTNFKVKTSTNQWYCWRHEVGGSGLELLAMQANLVKCEELHKGLGDGELFLKVLDFARSKGFDIPKQSAENAFLKTTTDAEGKTHITPDTEKLLDHLKHRFTYKTPTDTEQIYVYDNGRDDGIYQLGETAIKSELEQILGKEASIHIVNETLAHLVRGSYCDRIQFNQFKGEIPVQNGLLDLHDMKLNRFDPEKVFTFKINATYNLNADCPKFKKWLEEVQPSGDDRKLLQEFSGYCLLPALPYHKIIFLYGTGRNGKGTFVRTIRDILGKENTSAIPLETINSRQRFQLANLYGMLLNQCSEPNSDYVYNTEVLQRVIGQDQIDSEIKGKQRNLKFVNYAKFYVMGNRFPIVNSRTIAWWDRLLFIKWEKCFTQEKGNLIPDIERTWLNDPEERSGILNWLIDGLSRLLEKNGFTLPQSQQEMMLEFKKASDSEGAFITECLTIMSPFKITSADLYDAYAKYVEEYDLYLVDKNKFGRTIAGIPGVKSTQERISGKNTKVWQGIGLKNPEREKTAREAEAAQRRIDEELAKNKAKEEAKTEEEATHENENKAETPPEPEIASESSGNSSNSSNPTLPLENIDVESRVIKKERESAVTTVTRVTMTDGEVHSCAECGLPILAGARYASFKGLRYHLAPKECYHIVSEEAF
ncbi:phage/plasmid primase, P4 family [Candidatus Bathyarchaeota archaeon]|nr:phage/plasmid primase, P4 family [Candidatus Bathyarchaeota archaeon]